MVTENELNFDTGTSGQVLTSNGAGVAPTFQTAPTQGNLQLLQRKLVSAQANATFGITASISTYLFVFTNITLATGTNLTVQLSSDNGVSYDTTHNLSGTNSFPYNSATLTNSNTTGSILLATGVGSTNANSANGTLWCFGIGVASINTFCLSDMTIAGNKRSLGTGTNTTLTAVNSFKVIPDTGNFSGTITQFGIIE